MFAVLFSVLLGLWAAPRTAAGQARRRKSAYESLPQKALADSLSALGMTELTSELIKTAGGGDVRMTAAQTMITAAKGATDLAEREAKLDEAIVLLKAAIKDLDAQIAAATSPTDVAKATIKKMQTQLFIARTQAVTRGGPYADKLLFLQGSESDRKALIAATGGAAKVVRNLGADLEDLKLDWRRDMRIWIVVSRTVNDMEAEAKYRAAWIRFYHGMAARNTKTGRDDLRAVESLVSGFITGSRGAQVKEQSELLLARALRELGKHDVAADMLTKVISGSGPAKLRVDAEFERVRNLIEFGRTLAKAEKNGNPKYDAVPAALKTFEVTTKKLAADDQSKRLIDLWATLLEHYFYETRSKTEKNEPKAAEYGIKAQESLLGFLDKYADEGVRGAFYEIIYKKYRDRTDYANLSSAVLMAIASHEFDVARRDRRLGKKNTEAINAAKAVLIMINKRNDKVSKRVRPDVLWQLAFIFNFELDSFMSSRSFIQLAREFPDHKLAYTAAKYANDTMAKYVKDKGDSLDKMPPNTLALYGEALEVYTTGAKWKDEEKVLPWNFQYAELLAHVAAKTEQIQVKNAKAAAHNARLDVREAELSAKETKDPNAKARAVARAKKLKGTAAQLDAKAGEIISKASETYRKIAQTYERVPSKPHMARMQARQRAMMFRKYVLDLYPARTPEERRTRKAEALAMAELQIKFSSDVRAALKDEKNPGAVEDLKDWGSRAEFFAIEILFDHGGGGQADRAMRLLEGMAKKWPQTPILQQSEDLRIRKLVETGRIDDAITSLDSFMKKHKARGDDLLKMVITSLQDRIDRDEGATDKEVFDRWQKYVKNYVTLAGKLYKRVEQQPLDLRFAITQTYADALIKNGKYPEALEMFLKCQAFDEADAEKQKKKIAAEFGPMRAKAEQAQTYEVLTQCRKSLATTLERYGIKLEDAVKLEGDVMEMDVALAALKAMTLAQRDTEAGKRWIGDASEAAVKALKRLEARATGSLKVRAENVLGLARAYKGRADAYKAAGKTKEMQADYEQAIKYFRAILSANLDPSVRAQARMKWLAELGFCECVLSAMGKNKKAIRDMMRRMRILEQRDSVMGGYRDRFMTIRAKAERLLSR